jgi:hypothetical protein
VASLHAACKPLENGLDERPQLADFGGRPRDYGWWPADAGQLLAWYETVLQFALGLIRRGDPDISTMVAQAIARTVSELWEAGHHDALVRFGQAVAGEPCAATLWRGFAMVRAGRISRKCELEHRTQLDSVMAALLPPDLRGQLEAVVLGHVHDGLDPIAEEELLDAQDPSSLRCRSMLRAIARDLAQRFDEERAVVRWMLETHRPGYGLELGAAFASNLPDPAQPWGDLMRIYGECDPGARNSGFVAGVLCGIHARDAVLGGSLLQALDALPEIQSEVMSQLGAGDAEGVLLAARARDGTWRAHDFARFRARRLAKLSDAVHAELVSAVADLSDGLPVACELMFSRLHPLGASHERTFDATTIRTCRNLVDRFDLIGRSRVSSYPMRLIATAALAGEGSAAVARALAVHLGCAGSAMVSLGNVWTELADLVLQTHPEASLDAFFEVGRASGRDILLSRLPEVASKALSTVEPQVVLDWVAAAPALRAPWAAAHIEPIDTQSGSPELSRIARGLLAFDETGKHVLDAFADHMLVDSWVGPLAEKVKPTLHVLDTMAASADALIRDWASRTRQAIDSRVALDSRHHQERVEAFE